MSTTSNYPTIFVNGQTLQYFAKSHILSQWNNDFISTTAPLSNVLSNCTNLITTSNLCVGIMTSNPQYTLDVTGNIRATNTLFVSDLNIGGVSASGGGGIVTYSAILSGMCNINNMIPSGAVLYQVNSNILTNKAITYATINSAVKTGVLNNQGLYSINCTAYGNSSSYIWTLNNPPTTQVGGSNFTFINVPYSYGTYNLNVTVSTGSTGTASTIISPNFTFTADALQLPSVRIVNAISFNGTASNVIDTIKYYTDTDTFQFSGLSLGFSNLYAENNIRYNGYVGNNFINFNGSNLENFNKFFSGGISSSNYRTNNNPIPYNPFPVASNVSITVQNLDFSCNIGFNVAYIPSTTTTLTTIPNTNISISSVARTFQNLTSLGSIDVLYLPITNQFTSSFSFGLSNYISPAQTGGSVRNRLYINITPQTNTPLNTFTVNHNAAITDILVQWTNINSTFYSASASYLSTGCGSGTQTGGSWYIQRPSTMSQSTYSTILLYIIYNTSLNNIFPVPSIS